MNSNDFVDLLVQLGAMLSAAVLLGYVMRRLRQPSVVGEMAAGIVLGVTVLGALAPSVHAWIFDSAPVVTTTRDVIIRVGMMLFLFVAGAEVDLSDVKTLGRRSLTIGLVGTLVPIAGGVVLVYATPMSMWGEPLGIDRLPFSLFIGINLANSANPVLARILLDLGLMRSKIATVMMTATVVDDLVNWTLYAIVLGSVATAGAEGSDRGLALDLALVALLFVVILVGVRWLAPHLVGLARRHLAWPSGYIAVTTLVVFAAGGFADALGIHAFLGSFLAGVAFSGVATGVGAAGHRALTVVSVGVFAPLYFVTMALNTNFIEAFNPALVLTVTLGALFWKLLGVLAGVRASGLPLGREAWAMAWGLNARGATGIILAATGRQIGVINDEVFVALVLMAIVTSVIAGPAMVRALGPLRSEHGVDDEALADDDASEEEGAALAARVIERDLTDAERSQRDGILFRVLVAVDDPATAQPLVEVAADLAASQQPAEVILAAFEKQSETESKVMFHVLDAIASELDSLHHLESIVGARGLSVRSYSQRSTDLAADILAQAAQIGAHALVVGDRRDDADWVEIVDRLIAGSPTDIYVVVAPLPRPGAEAASGAPVAEIGEGEPGRASIEAAVRFAVAGTDGPVFVGGEGRSRAVRSAREVAERLSRAGRPSTVEPFSLDSVAAAAVARGARAVIRPFSAPEGLQPIERARPEAERFGSPLVLVAPGPEPDAAASLAALLDHLEAQTPSLD